MRLLLSAADADAGMGTGAVCVFVLVVVERGTCTISGYVDRVDGVSCVCVIACYQSDGWTSLMFACWGGNVAVVGWLVDEKGCDVNARSTVCVDLWLRVQCSCMSWVSDTCSARH
jgi:hypothetical protein